MIAHRLCMRQFSWIANLVRGTLIHEMQQRAAQQQQHIVAARRGVNKQRVKKSRGG